MSVEVQWQETDPATGERRFVQVRRHAGQWVFQVRAKRRDDWLTPPAVTQAMWEELLDGLERRYTRREGVSDADLAWVRARLAKCRPAPAFDGEVVPPAPPVVEKGA